MRIWANIYDASGNKLGDGQLDNIISTAIKRRLDGGGSFEVTLPLTDPRAVTLCQNERRIRLYLYDGWDTRELGRGVIRRRELSPSESEKTLHISGPDDMVELTFPSVGRGLVYDNVAMSSIVSGLVGLASGWTADVDAGLGNYSTRIDGGNPLSAVIKLAEQNGLHVRPALTAKTLEFGAFGTSLGIRAYGELSNVEAVQSNDKLLIIDRMTVLSESSDIINWMELRGGGEGDTAIDLAGLSSSRGTGFGDPYDIQTTTKNGETIYYITDATSVAAYGQIEATMVYKNLVPVSNSAADLLACRNAIYDAGVADLQRAKDPQSTYRVTLKKPRQTIRPGDKIRILYQGIVELENAYAGNTQLTYIDVDDEFWILTVDERIAGDAITLTLDVSTVDRHEADEVETIVGAIEEQRIRSVAIQPYSNMHSYVMRREISSEDSGYDATVPVYISNAVLRVQRCLLRVKTRPFRSTAKSTAHRHRMFLGSPGTDGSTASPPKVVTCAADAGGIGSTTVGLRYYSSFGDIYTESADGAQEYGIYDDSEYPEDVKIKVNGTDRTSALGGPWGTTATEMNEILDITDYINAAATLQQEHTITFSCDAGKGEVEVVVELYTVIQTLAVT